ncbi:hypothetical protein HK405_013112 [Cladochytrium tenue]|nr:hypothetical protein HK405_013112 [Cladochytrium tenue]
MEHLVARHGGGHEDDDGPVTFFSEQYNSSVVLDFDGPFDAIGDLRMPYLGQFANAALYTHIATMCAAYLFLFPVAIMLGIRRSKWHTTVAAIGSALAVVGYASGARFSHSTPNLYPHNAHHELGEWMLSLFLLQAFSGVLKSAARRLYAFALRRLRNAPTRLPLMYGGNARASAVEAVADDAVPDSPDGSRTGSHHSDTTLEGAPHTRRSGGASADAAEGDDDDDEGAASVARDLKMFEQTVPAEPAAGGAARAQALVRSAWRYYTLADRYVLRPFHSVAGRLTLALALLEVTLGLITVEGVCKKDHRNGYNCAAHLIKGGIFLAYGLFTFVRVLGLFRRLDAGLPRRFRGFRVETLESILILVYGYPNIYFENTHFIFNHKALQHQSLSFMWAMTGTASIIIEYFYIRMYQENPKAYFGNPLPSIIFLATGITFAVHEQETEMLYTLHHLIGIGLGLAAVARLMTQLLHTVTAPLARPSATVATELLAAFGFVFAGNIFMAANTSTATVLGELWGLSSGTIMNCTVGITLAWFAYAATLVAVLRGGKPITPADADEDEGGAASGATARDSGSAVEMARRQPASTTPAAPTTPGSAAAYHVLISEEDADD